MNIHNLNIDRGQKPGRPGGLIHFGPGSSNQFDPLLLDTLEDQFYRVNQQNIRARQTYQKLGADEFQEHIESFADTLLDYLDIEQAQFFNYLEKQFNFGAKNKSYRLISVSLNSFHNEIFNFMKILDQEDQINHPELAWYLRLLDTLFVHYFRQLRKHVFPIYRPPLEF